MEKSKLTAYVLNELNELERKEVEKYLEQNPTEKDAVEETKALSQVLKAELANELLDKAPPFRLSKLGLFKKILSTRSFQTSIGLAATASLIMVIVGPQLKNHLDDQTLQTINARGSEVATKKTGPLAANTAQPQSSQNLQAAPMTEQIALTDSVDQHTWGGKGASGAGGGATAGASLGFSGHRNRHRPALLESSLGNSESYAANADNQFKLVSDEPLSTFSIDVDTASYANSRRFLKQLRQLPPIDAIRSEEFINYFVYDYAQPKDEHPVAVHMQATRSPWDADKVIVRIGIKAKEIAASERPKSNLVFLVDVSGSMADENKLPLVKSALRTLTEQISKNDRVSIVVYAGQTGVLLESTPGDNKKKIIDTINNLSAGGGTYGEGGIRKAYEIAQKNFIKGGNNRVLLATDGDFNVGTRSQPELIKMINDKSEGGIFFTVLGFGMGNYKDALLEAISNKGQGNYFYIDSEKEAKKVFVDQLAGTLYTLGKDVKIQVEFNPELVQSYRLVGYENRMLRKEDFNNDKVDAGEIGAGHTVTALYEIVLKGSTAAMNNSVDPLKYQAKTIKTEPLEQEQGATFGELLTAKVRYKKPSSTTSEKIEFPLKNEILSLEQANCSTKWAIGAASLSQWLRGSTHLSSFQPQQILSMIEVCATTNGQRDEYKEEFIDMFKTAIELKK